MPFEDVLEKTVENRGFCVTENGYFGLVPRRARVGDHIIVLFGGCTPFVVRERKGWDSPSSEKCYWQLVGEAYVHGMMDGEALAGLKEGESSEEFILV
ncbi:hypothetical protein L207DRAFT_497721 [Hyaloscypha variabilis F]|uniref:Uncharacterized protein n=1 Tax=Hyaloscypha variabilis (strain UAMH 11265 / GT02V1 / F) TaxID=1149755 RepID=A0A2J6R760_HYAVF|nr:hypothetical protein L207DRAFT_497721 [Hyaloscypha variabilis F]